MNGSPHSPEKEIARGVVSIYKEHLGRGPTTARTELTDHVAITTLQDSLTRAEQSLIAAGEASTVRAIRRKFQEAMRPEITALVEQVTGRSTASFLSDHDTVKDYAVEMVVFADAD
jgi:uncharacterized protein YbcI